MEFSERLKARAVEGRPIRVGVVGCGQMGSGLLHVLQQMERMQPAAAADIDIARALAALRALGLPQEAICHADRADEARTRCPGERL